MCGRFTLTTPTEVLAKLFDLDQMPEDVGPRFNLAPTQQAPVVRIDESGGRRMELLRWGLVPSWADDTGIGSRLINARSETVDSKPAFRRSFRSRRCLVPADGFYEWTTEDGARQPYLFRLADGDPFAFAGLWDTWRHPDGSDLRTFTILTTEANEVVRPVHGRMPVVLLPDSFDSWLDPDVSEAQELAPLMAPLEPSMMVGYRVGRRVNSAKVDDPELVRPLP